MGTLRRAETARLVDCLANVIPHSAEKDRLNLPLGPRLAAYIDRDETQTGLAQLPPPLRHGLPGQANHLTKILSRRFESGGSETPATRSPPSDRTKPAALARQKLRSS